MMFTCIPGSIDLHVLRHLRRITVAEGWPHGVVACPIGSRERDIYRIIFYSIYVTLYIYNTNSIQVI